MPQPRPGPDQAVYVISVAAELSGMHPQTLRIYERKGLVDPARTTGGNRRYSEADVAVLLRIAQLTAQGLNLAGVKRVLALEAEVTRLEDELDRARSDGSQAVAEVHRKYRRDLVPVKQSVTVYQGRRSR
ncbi:MAG: MerR family transcriptional regulator [Actinomycetota bacterium]|nr:MerR family transcriptional regulator [Acidimicrobiaceae bacterium]MEC8982310.1 MerR family transcriptional regulator [Actinomycetota bacterium]MEC9426786.1 MerR family transcriptional regulator [Actinomycetota bacterium]MEC9449872.1 MerR family transcriptional regulator [Actinomycetota bacterium]MED5166920.1 MerR family transcriptional regulator [Actinomycetota bacterium]